MPVPTLIPLDGKPLALAVGKLQPGAKPVLALIVEEAVVQDGYMNALTDGYGGA